MHFNLLCVIIKTLKEVAKMDMGQRIKELRIKNGLTQEELGKYIGVQKSAIRKYEKGEVKNIKSSSIKILSKIFNISPSYLMCIDEPRKILQILL